MIFGFLRDHHLEEEEWYDICAIGYCKAVENYDKSRRFKFSTYAYQLMSNEVTDEIRKRNTPKSGKGIEVVTEDMKDLFGEQSSRYNLKPQKNFENDVILGLVIKNKIRIMSYREREIFKMLLDGLSVKEISEILNVSTQRVYELRKSIREKLRPVLDK